MVLTKTVCVRLSVSVTATAVSQGILKNQQIRRAQLKKCLNVRQKLGTRNVLKNLKNSHSFTFTTFATFTTFTTFNLSFNHSRHAEQFLFSSLCSKVAGYCKNCNGFFLTPASRELGVHRAGSQLKTNLSQFQKLAKTRLKREKIEKKTPHLL